LNIGKYRSGGAREKKWELGKSFKAAEKRRTTKNWIGGGGGKVFLPRKSPKRSKMGPLRLLLRADAIKNKALLKRMFCGREEKPGGKNLVGDLRLTYQVWAQKKGLETRANW